MPICVNRLCEHFVGEPFTQEEMEEMILAAVDQDKKVMYKDFVNLMAVEDT